MTRLNPNYYSVFIIIALSFLIFFVFTIQELKYAGEQGVPLDDSWIHFQFARNLSEGLGFSYHPGVQTPGSTSPLWVLILAGAYKVTHNLVYISKILGFLCLLVGMWGMYHISLLLTTTRKHAFFVTLFSLFTGRLFWGALSGMEIGLFTALTIWGIVLFIKYDLLSPGFYLSSVLFGLAALARPEGALLFLFACMLMVWQLFQEDRKADNTKNIFSICIGFGIYLILFGAIVCPQILFCLFTTGRPLPNTFYAKTHGVHLGLTTIKYVIKVAYYFFKDHPLLFCFLPFGLWSIYTALKKIDSKAYIVFAWFIGFPISNALINPITWHHGRYFMFLIPLFILFSVHGFFFVMQWERIEKLRLKEILLTLSILLSLGFLFHWSKVYARNVDHINQVDVRMGLWVEMNVPQDAVVAASDVGAIAYFSTRKIIDTDGLVTSDIIPYLKEMGREQGVFHYLQETKPDFVVAFYKEFQFLTTYGDIFKPVYSLRVTKNTILGGDRMVVYEAHWPLP